VGENSGTSTTPAPPAGRKSGVTKSDKLTLGAKFKNDLDSLMTALLTTSPHFIRCVKPNDIQAPNRFDPVLALRQLKYAGLFEAIHIRKAGYAIRLPMEQFIHRYKHCTRSALRFKLNNASQEEKIKVCQSMMAELSAKLNIVNIPNQPAAYAIGFTKIFFRSLKTKHLLEECRNGSVDFVAVQLQRVVRGFIDRKKIYAILGETKRLKEQQRARERSENASMIKMDEECKMFEEFFRNNKEQQQKEEDARRERIRIETERVRLKLMKAATRIQKIFRGGVARGKAKVMLQY
jgi:myosin-5